MLVAGARARRRRRLRLDRDPHRRPRRGDGDDLRPQLHRPRDRRHHRDRDLLDDRCGQPAPSPAHRPRQGSPTRSSQPGSSQVSPASSLWRPSAGTPLRAEAAAQPDRDADPLVTKKTTTVEAPAPKRRRADAERSVAAILDAALEALASDPDSSMSEIARRAGVVRATIYVHFPTRESLLDAVMEHAVAQVAEATRAAEPECGGPAEALERVLRATWQQLAQFHGLLALNTARLSAEELYRRHLPILDQFAPLIERGQKAGVFRSDLPVSWQLAVIRSLVHTASAEIRGGRIPESEAEAAMISTVGAAISERPTSNSGGSSDNGLGRPCRAASRPAPRRRTPCSRRRRRASGP